MLSGTFFDLSLLCSFSKYYSNYYKKQKIIVKIWLTWSDMITLSGAYCITKLWLKNQTLIFFKKAKFVRTPFYGKGSELQKSECQKSKRTSKIWKGSERQKFPLKWSEHQKIRTTTTTYAVLPMDTKACGG
jgi:hypothetical protein